MLLATILLWVGISILYFGFAGVFGVLAKQAYARRSAWMKILTLLHATLLFIPASIFVLGLPESTPLLQIPVLFTGIFIIILGYKQPKQIPDRIWGRAFAHRYFGVAMIVAALWGLSTILASDALLNLPVAAATSFAGAVAFLTAPRIA